MSESDYIDVLNKPFIYAVLLVIYANSLSGCSMHISSIEPRNYSAPLLKTLNRKALKYEIGFDSQ